MDRELETVALPMRRTLNQQKHLNRMENEQLFVQKNRLLKGTHSRNRIKKNTSTGSSSHRGRT